MRELLIFGVLISVLSTLGACSYTEKVTQSILPNSEFNMRVVEGDAAMEAADWAKAISRYQEAIRLAPESMDVRLKLGTAFQRHGKLANAYNEYQQVIQMAEAKGDTNNKAAQQAKQLMAKAGFKPTTEEEIIPSPSELFALNTPATAQAEENPPQDAVPTPAPIAVEMPSLTVVDVGPAKPTSSGEETARPVSSKEASASKDSAPQSNAPEHMDSVNIQHAIEARMVAWQQAWEGQHVEAYWALYSPMFKGDLASHEAWKKQRKQKIQSAKSPRVSMGAIKFEEVGTQRVSVKFKQQYRAGQYTDSGTKTMLWTQVNGQWLIAEELFVPEK